MCKLTISQTFCCIKVRMLTAFDKHNIKFGSVGFNKLLKNEATFQDKFYISDIMWVDCSDVSSRGSFTKKQKQKKQELSGPCYCGFHVSSFVVPFLSPRVLIISVMSLFVVRFYARGFGNHKNTKSSELRDRRRVRESEMKVWRRAWRVRGRGWRGGWMCGADLSQEPPSHFHILKCARSHSISPELSCVQRKARMWPSPV